MRRAHFAARPKAPASPPCDTWKLSARQREAMGDVDPRGSRQVNPCLQHWDTAASKHEERGRGEGVKYFQPFSLVCISWCLLQLCAESERTTDRLHTQGLVIPRKGSLVVWHEVLQQVYMCRIQQGIYALSVSTFTAVNLYPCRSWIYIFFYSDKIPPPWQCLCACLSLWPKNLGPRALPRCVFSHIPRGPRLHLSSHRAPTPQIKTFIPTWRGSFSLHGEFKGSHPQIPRRPGPKGLKKERKKKRAEN